MNNQEFTGAQKDSDDGGRASIPSEAKWLLNSLLTTAQDCIYFKDRKSRFIKISPAHARIFGLSDPEEAVGKTDFDFSGGEHAREAFEDEQKIIETGEPLLNIEEREVWPDGSVTWFSTSKVPLRDDSGFIVGIMGISRDITERKTAEAALRASEHKFRSVVESSPTGMYFYDLRPQGTLILTGSNPSADRIIGIDHSSLIGLPIEQAFPSLVGTDIPERFLNVAKGLLGPQTFEMPYEDARFGGFYEVDVFQTGPANIAVVFQDISQRKLQERHIQQVTRLYAAMSQMNQAILRSRTRDGLFFEVCRALVESAHFDMAWVGWVAPGNPKVEPVACYGDNFEYLKRIEVFCDERPAGRGPVGTTIREGTTQVVNNFLTNPRTSPWHDEASRSGWQSCIAVPVREKGRSTGALAVYSKVPGYFSEKEVILLERAAADISSALENIDALAEFHR